MASESRLFDLKEFMEGDFNRFTFSQNLPDALMGLRIATDSAFIILWAAMGKTAPNAGLHDAHHLAQLMAVRSTTILRLSHAAGYHNLTNPERSLKPTLDPASVAPLVRSQYEAFAALNNIFIQHRGAEQEFLYHLWVISGLKYRQRFKSPLRDERIPHELDPELVAKAEVERKAIEALVSRVEASDLFLGFRDEKRQEIRDAMHKRKEFKLFLREGTPVQQSWPDLFRRSVDTDIFEPQYTYLSLWAHPSNVSAFTFEQMYSAGASEGLIQMGVNLAAFILGFMLRDQMSLFPECRRAFDDLPPPHQVLLDGWNGLFRGEDMRIVNIQD
jgi:hypothetical protein